MADERYVVILVERIGCKTKQKVHVAAGTGAARASDRTISCLNCGSYFNVKVPDRIIRGPFPA